MKIILSGGGTLGPVTPLLAIREAILQKYSKTEFIWVGTKNGPEKEIVEKAGIKFFTIGAGKWRRYLSFLNILDIFKIIIAAFQSVFLIVKEKPDLLISAGGFVSVPLHFAGWVFGVPGWVHQQDVKVGLANRLMFPFAKKITTALGETAERLPKSKTEWLGNPFREWRPIGAGEAKKYFNIPAEAKVIFALGGGTGSASINKLILDALTHWPADWHIIHLTGKDRHHESNRRALTIFPNYHVYDFFTSEMSYAYYASDIVVGRAGFGTLTELAALSKPAVILPIFGTHQEDNARWFAERHGIITLPKGTDMGLKLARQVKDLVLDPSLGRGLGTRLHGLLPRPESGKITNIVDELINE